MRSAWPRCWATPAPAARRRRLDDDLAVAQGVERVDLADVDDRARWRGDLDHVAEDVVTDAVVGGVDGVVALFAVDRVGTVTRVDDVVALVAGDLVVARTGVDEVVALVAVELVVALFAVHTVRAGPTLGVVVARAAVHDVTTVVAVQVVVAVLAVGDVVAAAQADVVVAREAVDLLSATLGDDRVVAVGALHRLAVDRSRSAWLRAGRGLARRRSGDRGCRDGGQAQDLGRHERSEQPGSWGERTHVAKVTRLSGLVRPTPRPHPQG